MRGFDHGFVVYMEDQIFEKGCAAPALMVSWGASAELSVVHGTAVACWNTVMQPHQSVGEQNRGYSPRASLFGHVGS